MEPFVNQPTCSKCGSSKVIKKYIAPRKRAINFFNNPIPDIEECMDVTCKICDYSWEMKTRDMA